MASLLTVCSTTLPGPILNSGRALSRALAVGGRTCLPACRPPRPGGRSHPLTHQGIRAGPLPIEKEGRRDPTRALGHLACSIDFYLIRLHQPLQRDSGAPTHADRLIYRGRLLPKVVTRVGVGAKGRLSPIGESGAEDNRRAAAEDAEVAAEMAKLMFYEEITRLVIRYRMDHDLSQGELV